MMHKLSFIELACEGERLCKSGDCSQGIRYFEAALQKFEQQQRTHQTNHPHMTTTTATTVASSSSLPTSAPTSTHTPTTLKHQNETGGAETMSQDHNNANSHESDEAAAAAASQEYQQMLKNVSAIYNQMGNAYFNLHDYKQALECHKKDLALSEQLGDETGKGKACGNMGNTLQLMGDHDEAIYYLKRNLEIVKKLNDVSGEARACYNLANIYQAKGKYMAHVTYPEDQQQEPNTAEFVQEIREVLLTSVAYYKETLKFVANKERSAEGRTYGNLGNTYYLLGDFDSAIQCHLERLRVTREFGDKAAERRAYANLGNCYIFQGKFVEAAEYYLKAMNVARSLGDKAIEAQSYYSLGNAYTLLQDYALSIDFHHRHLLIAQTLDDKVGECRAYWSLGNSYAAMGDLENAIIYANKHLNLAQLIGDSTSELTAKKNLYDFQNLLTSSGFRDSESGLFTPICSKYGRKYLDKTGTGTGTIHKSASIDSFYTNVIFDRINGPGGSGGGGGMYPPGGGGGGRGSGGSDGPVPLRSLNNKPTSQGDLSLKMMTSAGGGTAKHHSLTDIENKGLDDHFGRGGQMGAPPNPPAATLSTTTAAASMLSDPDLSFLEQITRMQSKRLDDQRCSLKPTSSSSLQSAASAKASGKQANGGKDVGAGSTLPKDDFLDLIMKSQRTRLEDQRSSFSNRRTGARLAGGGEVKTTATNGGGGVLSSSSTNLSASSSTAEIGGGGGVNSKTYSKQSSKSHKNSLPPTPSTHKPTTTAASAAANDELFQMIERVQSRRFDEQRAPIKSNSLFRFGRRS